MSPETDPFLQWFDALEERHLANLSFAEVRRAVQALSSLYVERREKLGGTSVFGGAGKRAAFALFFAPLHFLLVREIVRGLGATQNQKTILDLGCGTGSAGAAWALEMKARPSMNGVDRNSWAAQEAKWTYHKFGLRGGVRVADIGNVPIPADTAVIAAFTINELDPLTREKYLVQFVRAARRGSPVLVIEPIARRLTSWWDDWEDEFKAAGGRKDNWRFQMQLPERLALMDRAAGLDHHELTGRSLWLGGEAS